MIRSFYRKADGTIQEDLSAEALSAAARDEALRRGADFLFHDILDNIVDQYLSTVADWDRTIDEYEPRIIASPEYEILREVMEFKRALLELRQTIAGQRRDAGSAPARGLPRGE